tara:strand:+ start:19448 stop:20515 length:1068 start_codon:yes stop_codon:yes gene_type:complete
MKKVSYLYLLFALLAAPLFNSCENEPLTGEFSSTPDGSDSTTDDDGILDSEECTLAIASLSAGQSVLAAATEESYNDACVAYATILDFVITNCGDPNNTFQNTLNSLGDCSYNPCIQAQASSALQLGIFQNADEEGQTAACFNYLAALENQITVCGDPSGSVQAAIDGLPCDNDCDNAIAATADAQATYDAVDEADESAYTQACTAYKAALEAQISACGDEDGSLLSIVASLGDCTPPEQPGPLQMFVDGEYKNFNSATVSVSGSTLNVLATDEDTNDSFFFRVVLNQVGVNVLQDEVVNISGVQHNPVTSGSDVFVDEVTTNTSGTLIGTFSGEMMTSEGDILVITDGTFDIRY